MITVLIPTKNHAQYLVNLIPSLLSENSPFEKIFICDDGSTDGTSELLFGFSKNKKIRLFHNQVSLGPSRSIVSMFSHVDTAYVMFLASDDLVDNAGISRLVEKTTREHGAWGFSRYSMLVDDRIVSVNHPGWNDRCEVTCIDFIRLFMYDFYMYLGASIISVSHLRQLRGNSPFDLRLNQWVEFDGIGEFRACDWDLGMAMSATFPNRMVFLDECCGFFRQHRDQLSAPEKYVYSGRAAYEMACLILKYGPMPEFQNCYFKNHGFFEIVRRLLKSKVNSAKINPETEYFSQYQRIISAAAM